MTLGGSVSGGGGEYAGEDFPGVGSDEMFWLRFTLRVYASSPVWSL